MRPPDEREYILNANEMPDPPSEGEQVTFTDRFGTYTGIVESLETFEQPDGDCIVRLKTRETDEGQS